MATTSCPRPRRALPVALSAILVAGLALGAVTGLAGCGKKGDPLPPPRLVPTALDDLSVSQQGADFLLEMGYPRTTVGGGVLPPLSRLEVLSVVQPTQTRVANPDLAADTSVDDGTSEDEASEDGASENGASEDGASQGETSEDRVAVALEPMSTNQFEAQATPRLILNEADLVRATSGSRIFLRVPVPGLAEGVTEAGTETWTFAIRTVAEGSEPSAISNLAVIIPRSAPEPPRGLTVVPRPDGLEIRWQAPGTDPEGLTLTAYNVYRREARSRAYRRDPVTVGGSATEYVDSSARFGQRYIYTVTSVSQRRPLVESRLSGEAEVFYQDRFPPQAPPSLVALAEEGTVRVRWDPSPSADTAGYHVYRRDTQAGDFRRITRDPVNGRELTDEGLRSGRTYAYRVTAVDGQGNEGEASGKTEATVR